MFNNYEIVEYTHSLPLQIQNFTGRTIQDDRGDIKDVLEHWHQEIEIVYTFEGHALHYIDGKVHRAAPGKLFVTNSESIHKVISDEGTLGTPDTKYRHFTAFSKEHSAVNGELADGQQIKMMNPLNYIADDKAVKAEHFRIRHGAIDRDTSLAISAMLTASLENHGVDVELQYPWGMPHAGDYDLEELFAWIDKICG